MRPRIHPSYPRSFSLALAGALGAFVFSLAASAPAAPSAEEVRAAMRRAAAYFSESVAVEGGYVYYVSLDGGRRLGEGAAGPREVWVQPPGTPTAGEAYLDAHEATGDPFYLEAAIRAGKALAHGQLESGGWRNSIDFDPAGPRADRYRNGRGRAKGANFSTLDDDITQAALRFLMRLDAACGFAEPAVRDAVAYALPRLLEAQYASGAFPQGWNGPAAERPAAPKASLPAYDWRSEGRIKEYWHEYTLNDGVALATAETLIEAGRIYGDPVYAAALRRLGEFLVLAQLPEPQAGWAQQYNAAMHPIWARAFEPPAVSGRESEDAMLALLLIAEACGDPAFAAPVVPGVGYLERSLLPDGRLARFYELGSNRPLYLTRSGGGYELSYDDSTLPGHYGWKNAPRLDLVKEAYRAVLSGEPLAELLAPPVTEAGAVAAVLEALDEEGRWVTTHGAEPAPRVGQPKFAPGEHYLDSAVFAENLSLLARWLLTVAVE